MQFNSVRSGSFSGLAGHVNKATDQAFDAARSTAVDHTAIAKESIKGRSLERRAAMKAESDVAQAGLKAFSKAKDTKNAIDSKKKINDILRPAKRMAGMVAGLGALTAGYTMMEENKKTKAENDALRAEQAAFDAQQEARWAASDRRYEQLMGLYSGNKGGSGGELSSPSTPSSGGVKPPSSGSAQSGSKGKSTGMKYMSTLVSKGFTPTQAAALVGHLDVESDGFRAHEEYSPNAYGTKGAGVLQWTDIPGGSQRRSEFQNWSSSQGLDPKSFEANSGYLLHEMQTGNHWTGGASLEGFKGITDLNKASKYLESNYIRPSAGSSGRRQTAGQSYLSQWNSSNK